MLEDCRSEHIAANDGKVRGRHGGLGLLDDAAHAAGHRAVGLHRDDAVLLGVLARHHLHPEDAGALGPVDVRHLRQAGDVAANQIVREMHEEWLGAHGGLRA